MLMICMFGVVVWVVVSMWLMVWLVSRFLGLVMRCSGFDGFVGVEVGVVDWCLGGVMG